MRCWAEEVWLARPRGKRIASLRSGSSQPSLLALGWLRARRSAVRARQEAYLRRKNETQPVTLASAGCAFRNPDGDSAGRLIEAAGMKGAREGGLVLSERHANFLVHEGEGTTAQALRLLERVEEAVSTQFDVQLRREIVIWSEPN